MDGVNGNAIANGNVPPPFLSKTYDMVEDPSTDSIVSWSPSNDSFVVWDLAGFSRDLLPKYFKHNNFSSFVRQLNTYGFRKVDPDRWEFSNEGFVRGQKHLLKSINRRKSAHMPSQPQRQNKSVGACVEVGKFGIEEEIERLKRDKNVLMQELVKLRQQQQATDRQLQTVVQHLQGMEQHQQQMMSFLAKAMQSPGFLAQLVQQNESNRRIARVNKKRRLPGQEDDLGDESEAGDGQIVKYQPLLNESAKAILSQILKIDTSPRLESSNNSQGFLIDDVPAPPLASDNKSRVVGVTLSEVPPNSDGLQYLPVASGGPGVLPTAAMSDIGKTAQLPDIRVLSGIQEAIVPCSTDMIIPEIPQIQEVPECTDVDVLSSSYVVPEIGNGYLDPVSREVDAFPMDTEKFYSDTDMDAYAFWEQFLLESPVSGDIGELASSSQEVIMSSSQEVIMKEIQPEWENVKDHLAEQMEHSALEIQR